MYTCTVTLVVFSYMYTYEDFNLMLNLGKPRLYFLYDCLQVENWSAIEQNNKFCAPLT